MKNRFVYKSLKRIADQAIRFANRNLPALRASQVTEMLPPVPAFTPALPQNVAQLPVELAAYFREEISLPAIRLFTLRQVSVSWHAVVFKGLRMFLPALAHPREIKHYDDTYLLQQWTGKPVHSPADGRPLVLVHNQWTSTNYYHWMVDSLPRLLLLQSNYAHCRLLMPAPVPAYVRDSAAMLGFTELLLLQRGATLTGADLLIPEHVAPPGYQHPALLRRIQQQLIEAVYLDTTPPRPFRKVYVSRRSQRVRRLVNEDDIRELLAQYGFEIREFEGLTVEQQVRLMTETKTFVTLHGAGLTNMLFLPAGAQVAELLNADKIVELTNQHFENLIYFRMAAALNLPYYCLPCSNASAGSPTNDADLCLDLEALRQLLDLMAIQEPADPPLSPA